MMLRKFVIAIGAAVALRSPNLLKKDEMTDTRELEELFSAQQEGQEQQEQTKKSKDGSDDNF